MHSPLKLVDDLFSLFFKRMKKIFGSMNCRKCNFFISLRLLPSCCFLFLRFLFFFSLFLPFIFSVSTLYIFFPYRKECICRRCFRSTFFQYARFCMDGWVRLNEIECTHLNSIYLPRFLSLTLYNLFIFV